LSFPGGALVHFAVSNSEVMMTTHLKGAATDFLPFNQGNDGGKGNPPNPQGHPTAYLWEKVWERESLLEIIGKYLVTKRDQKKKITSVIFPRYHQLDVTRALLKTVLEEGAGKKYLIQHSAGSGKTNSIAWTAHFLVDLHDQNQNKMFDSVLVVSDRNVIDQQLQDAIYGFERTVGVVATITGKEGSKSGQLAKALSGDKKIVVCTIQTFPFALTAVQELAATQGKRFAVIADEAHSSQSGGAAANLKLVLTAEELKVIDDGGEISTEDILAAQMTARANDKGITYVAFTATPKGKTLELFGRCPDPGKPAGKDNLPLPFHVYSMQQAIEEGFILDVLRNYTSYKLAFKLASGTSEWSEQEVDKAGALKGLMRWVRLHPYNISQKVQIVVEHFWENVAPLLDGKAKAMVVVGSRLEAVRWKLVIEEYIKEKAYQIGTLVAFSGEVFDKESWKEPFSEVSKTMNPGLRGVNIREAFNGEQYHILLVANKFQTGFDQPLLCGMYIDKRLDGIQAVQTLSRLNRCYPGKDTTYILDFVNEPEEILSAFKVYYKTAELEGTTDPDLVYKLRAALDSTGFYDGNEVNRVVEVALRPKATQADLMAAVKPVADRLLRKFMAAKDRRRLALERKDVTAQKEAREELDFLELFRHNLAVFARTYSFLSQIFDYGNTDIEKRYIFYRYLAPLLDFGLERETVDLSKAVLTHHKLKHLGKRELPLSEGEADKIKPLTESGSGSVHEKEKARMREIIERLNEIFGADCSDGDKYSYCNTLMTKLAESKDLAQQARNNTKEQFSNSPDLSRELMNAIMDALSAHTAMSKQALDSERVRADLLKILLGPAGLYESLRGTS